MPFKSASLPEHCIPTGSRSSSDSGTSLVCLCLPHSFLPHSLCTPLLAWGLPPPIIATLQCRETVWPYAASSSERNRVKLRHPATMPDRVAGDLILGFSEPGDLVLDYLMGSGTSLVMAARLGRRYLGMEASAEYVEIARQRMARGVNTEPRREESKRQARRNADKALEDAQKKDARKASENAQEAPRGAEGDWNENMGPFVSNRGFPAD